MNQAERWHTITLDEVDSTNNYLRDHCAEQEHAIILVTAEHQSAGRGQRGNSWESERSRNLIFSLQVHPQLPVSHIFSLSEACALAIRDALATYTKDIEVKWPNDIYWHDKKIAGILIETSLTGKRIETGIIGVGVNINQRHFLSDAPNPVSLSLILDSETDRQEVMERIMEQFTANMGCLQRGEFDALHQRYMQVLYRRQGFHPYSDEEGKFMAEILSVEPSGHLILGDEQGRQRRYAFKEVQFLLEKTTPLNPEGE